MARLAACASTNFTTSTTWAAIDSTSYRDSEAGNTALSTTESSNRAASGPTPGAITIDGIGIKVASRAASPSGTLTVQLYNLTDTAVVASTAVTVNISDLPISTAAAIDGGWFFLKFGASVTLPAGKVIIVSPVTSSAAQINLFRDATTSNWSSYLRTTSTGAPGAGDDLIITKEWTAAATGTAITVTMDNTATTDFGSAPTAANGLLTPGIAITNGGTLTWGTTAATNYYLRMSNNIIVYNGGTYNQGTTGTPVPRDSTAKLFFDCGADGDYGMRVRGRTASQTGGTCNIQGLSRTSGKNVVATKMTLDMPVFNKLVAGTTSTQGLGTATNVTQATGTTTGVDGYSLLGVAVTDNTTNAYHAVSTGAVLNNTAGTKHFCSIWLKRGSGTNNRYVRLQCGNTAAAALTNGFYADFDLSAVTASAYTNVGTGAGDGTDVATITAVGDGFLCTITGVPFTASAAPWFGALACNGAASPSYVGDTTQNFIYQGPKVFQLTYTPTITIASPGVVTATAHGLGVGAQVKFTTSGALPTGITASTTYYVCGGDTLTANTFQIATSLANAQAQPPTAINTSGSQSGTHTLTITAPTGTLTVNDDTGWLSGDMIAVASTSRTNTDSEPLKMTSNATSTTLPCTVPLTGGVGASINCCHSGSSPTQAEVILMTRNVVVAGFSPTLMASFTTDNTSVVDIDWAEFYYVGDSTWFGIGIGVTTGSFNMQYSSIHDCEIGGLHINATAANNITFSNNTMWYLATSSGPAVTVAATSGTSITIDSNVLIRTGAGNGWTLADVGGTFTNNTVAGAASNGISFGETNGTFGSFSGNVSHSNTSNGFTNTSNGMNGVFGSATAWRNTGFGFSVAGAFLGKIPSLTAFGNASANVNFATSAAGSDIWFTSPVLNGDSTFSTVSNINFASPSIVRGLVDDGDFSTASGIKTAATNDLNVGGANFPVGAQFILRNTKLGASTEVSTQTSLADTGYISSEKTDQTAGNHVTWVRYGKLQTDSTTYNTAAPSMLMTPNNASGKLESATQFNGMKVAVASGATCTISVYVRKSASYNGNQPRLIQKANPALGQSSNVVIDTMTVGTGSWEQLTGASSTASGDDGAWEFVVDCDGTAGAINVDDWAAS